MRLEHELPKVPSQPPNILMGIEQPCNALIQVPPSATPATKDTHLCVHAELERLERELPKVPSQPPNIPVGIEQPSPAKSRSPPRSPRSPVSCLALPLSESASLGIPTSNFDHFCPSCPRTSTSTPPAARPGHPRRRRPAARRDPQPAVY